MNVKSACAHSSEVLLKKQVVISKTDKLITK